MGADRDGLDVLLRQGSPPLLKAHIAAGEEPLAARLLAARGLDREALGRLQEDGEQASPKEVPGLSDLAADLRSFLQAGGRLAIHGDYDVDGISGSAIVLEALRAVGFDADVFLPHRLRDGYGLSASAVERLASQGVQGIVTVDCGISSVAAAERAAELGVRLWITDHHALPRTLPRAPFAHPGLLPADHPLAALSGAGVALQLARVLAEGAPPLEDLCALGTLADQVPLCGENRSIVRRGLRQIRDAPRPGLSALLQVAAYRGAIDEETVQFILAPRLNASGRMASPDLALQLLQAGPGEAAALASRLDELNRSRQEIEREVLESARQQLAEASCAVAAGEGWHRGVIGIVAARLVDERSRPAFVVSVSGEEAHGSARAPEGAPLLPALKAAGDLLVEYGGHAAAAGFRVRARDIAALRVHLEEYYSQNPPRPAPRLVDGRMRLGEATLAAIGGMERLRPFGQGNPAPVWLVEDAEVLEDRPIGGGRHRSLRLRDSSGEVTAVHWRGAGVPSTRLDIVAALEENSFRGRRSPRLRLLDRAVSAREILRGEALAPPQSRGGGAPATIADRRGQGVGETCDPCQIFTLDGTRASQAAQAMGEGYYPAGLSSDLMQSLYRSGRLRGVVGPHPVRGLPLKAVYALERPAEPDELRAVADGLPLVLAYRQEDEAMLSRVAQTWAPDDGRLRDAYREMRRWSPERLQAPPDDAELAVAWLVFSELGLIVPEGLGKQSVDLRDSHILAALRRRAARFAQTRALFYGPSSALAAALGVSRPLEDAH